MRRKNFARWILIRDSIKQRGNNFHYFFPGKLTRLPMDDLPLLVNNKGKGDSINNITQLMSQGNTGNTAD